MFILPNPPSPQAAPHELADFAELLCWHQARVSAREIVAYLGRIDDNEYNVGCDDDDDKNAEALDEVMNEIDRRAKACGGGYPFALEFEGTALCHAGAKSTNHKSIIYHYLLLSTRLNMKEARVHAKLDGADLLEELSAHALRKYLGGDKAKSFVFGTSMGGSFKDRVKGMCINLCEGSGFRSLGGAPVSANDDKLDAVAWVPFTDRLPGQLIIFGQCKTGSNWGELVHQLQPDVFVKKWMITPIIVNPVRALCVSEAADRSVWDHTSVAAGILFDRCRLVDYCDDVDQELLRRIVRWTMAAKRAIDFSKPPRRLRLQNKNKKR